MQTAARERAALLAFFLPLTRRTCAELQLGDHVIAAYLADVLVEFARAERLWRLRDLEGRRLTSIVEMLGRGPATSGPAVPVPESERDFLRYVGDFALFMSGIFRPWAERGGFLGWYLADGALAYARAAALGDAAARRERLILAELATRFEPYAGALDYLRRVHLTGLAGPDPLRAFLREITGLVGRASRN
jgi:hypothetical protein